MSDTILKVDGVAKKFCRTLKHTMFYGGIDLTRTFFGLNQHSERLRSNEFWAVDNLSFELKRGECLGVIGPNGSGKSTLLKMLNGIFMPDKGRIEIKGRVGALIEVGAGFHPMLTGRENIYINGSILGFTKKEIDKKFDEIIEFAELSEFIDAPVKHYSSGMFVRLGFAVAAQMEPDILLIDEVLAVGDVGFRGKCINAIAKMMKKAAVIFVSHSMPQVGRISSDICVMSNGRVAFQGKDVSRGIEHYYSQFDMEKSVITGSGRATIHSIEFESNGKENIHHINYMEDLTLRLCVMIDREIRHPIIGVSFLSQELQIVSQCVSKFNKIQFHNRGTPHYISIKFKEVNLNPGRYLLSVYVLDEGYQEVLAQYYAIKELKVRGDFVGLAPVQLLGEWDIKE
jgi:lipopolysaccharide transport system ATP-binding protein